MLKSHTVIVLSSDVFIAAHSCSLWTLMGADLRAALNSHEKAAPLEVETHPLMSECYFLSAPKARVRSVAHLLAQLGGDVVQDQLVMGEHQELLPAALQQVCDVLPEPRQGNKVISKAAPSRWPRQKTPIHFTF